MMRRLVWAALILSLATPVPADGPVMEVSENLVFEEMEYHGYRVLHSIVGLGDVQHGSVLSARLELSSSCPASLEEFVVAFVLIGHDPVTDLSLVWDSPYSRSALLFRSEDSSHYRADVSLAYIAASNPHDTAIHLYLAIDCSETACACDGLFSEGSLRFLKTGE